MNVETGNEVGSFISGNICFEFSVQCLQLQPGKELYFRTFDRASYSQLNSFSWHVNAWEDFLNMTYNYTWVTSKNSL
jgi:hypothetical protein